MALVDIIMPQMGESIAEGTLSKWLKKVGDEVKRDEPIFEISTDKVDAEIPAASAGVLAEILVNEGETVAVQTVVARLETEKGAMVVAASTGSASGAAKSAGTASVVATSTVAPPKGEYSSVASEPPHPSATRSSKVSPAGNGNSFENRVRIRSSPLVRRIAADHGLDVSALTGTGIAGRVTRKDILGFIESGAPYPAGMPSMHAPGGAGHAETPLPQPWPGDRVETMSKMRAV